MVRAISSVRILGAPCALVALLGLTMSASAGCGKRKGTRRANPPMQYVGAVANGRPDTCPDDAVDPMGDGTPTPMDLRCSYADAAGGPLTQVRGRVFIEGAPGSLGDSPGRVTVVLHQAAPALGGPLGRKVGEGTTDPQGSFSISATLRAGDYVLAVAGEGAKPRARRRITVGGDAGHRIDGVRIVIPRPMSEPEP